MLDYIAAPYIGKEEADDFHIIYAKYYYPEYYNKDYVLSNYIPSEKSEEYRTIMQSLFPYDNVRIFFFQNDPALILLPSGYSLQAAERTGFII